LLASSWLSQIQKFFSVWNGKLLSLNVPFIKVMFLSFIFCSILQLYWVQAGLSLHIIGEYFISNCGFLSTFSFRVMFCNRLLFYLIFSWKFSNALLSISIFTNTMIKYILVLIILDYQFIIMLMLMLSYYMIIINLDCILDYIKLFIIYHILDLIRL